MSNKPQSWRDATSNALFALSLTALMAAALFVTVAVNPKSENYRGLPWSYAACCLLGWALLHLLQRRFDQAPRPAILAEQSVAARTPRGGAPRLG
jgi:uncharacterized membrane protein YhdT